MCHHVYTPSCSPRSRRMYRGKVPMLASPTLLMTSTFIIPRVLAIPSDYYTRRHSNQAIPFIVRYRRSPVATGSIGKDPIGGRLVRWFTNTLLYCCVCRCVVNMRTRSRAGWTGLRAGSERGRDIATCMAHWRPRIPTNDRDL